MKDPNCLWYKNQLKLQKEKKTDRFTTFGSKKYGSPKYSKPHELLLLINLALKTLWKLLINNIFGMFSKSGF